MNQFCWSSELKLLIAYSQETTLSETFLRAQSQRLRADIEEIIWGPKQKSIVNGGIHGRLRRRFERSLNRRSYPDQIDYELIRHLQRNATDVVLAQYGRTGTNVMTACESASVPLVVHFHGFDASRVDVREQNVDKYRSMFSIASRLVVVSRAMKETLISWGAPASRIVLNPYGVDTERFTMTDPSANGPVLLHVGNFVEKKAPHLTLLAFAQAHEQLPDLRLRMIGGGPLLGACHSLVRGLGIEEAVELLGPQSHERVVHEMQTVRGFVQHSVVASNGDSEGLPNAILEAAASALPIVSTRHAGIPDFVEHGVNGLLCDEHEVGEMARHMIQIGSDPSIAKSMGLEGRNRVESSYTWDHSISNLMSILEDARNDSLSL